MFHGTFIWVVELVGGCGPNAIHNVRYYTWSIYIYMHV